MKNPKFSHELKTGSTPTTVVPSGEKITEILWPRFRVVRVKNALATTRYCREFGIQWLGNPLSEHR